MSVFSSLDYKKALDEEPKLKMFIYQLDTMTDMLYNNLEYEGIWDVLNKMEDVRIKYYLRYDEVQTILETKGKIHE